MPRTWKIALVVSLLLNVALIAGVVAMVVSEGTAGAVAPRPNLASEEDVQAEADRADTLESRVADAEAQLQGLASSDLASELGDLDSRVAELEDEVGSSFAIDDLSSRVADTEDSIRAACTTSRSAALSAIGSDLFDVFLSFERAFC
jgi:hypothetical protein